MKTAFIAALAAAALAGCSTEPAGTRLEPTGVIVASQPGTITGDPQIVRDGDEWLMYMFRTAKGAPHVRTLYATANGLRNKWSEPVSLEGLDGYHKFVVLTDEHGRPARIGGAYHGYAASFDGDLASKSIAHFSAPGLKGPWSRTGTVIAKGAPGSRDGFSTDTPSAVVKDGVIDLVYMGAPDQPLPLFGLAERMLRATAPNPAGPFAKQPDDVMLPSTDVNAWDHGWLGGAQRIRLSDGSWMMVYNAGSSRPERPGEEPLTSRIGYAYAPTHQGPWTRDRGNPYLSPSPQNPMHVWRGFMAQEDGDWLLFYNFGSGTERITYAEPLTWWGAAVESLQRTQQ
ncbi:hypothetical protein [Caldimonas sp. KR1-144]|uniref:hypothetical protein n=1 Tax=Caldimonas sp. KR1-144 TaxID=3400911 RepID=UPI003BFBFF6B